MLAGLMELPRVPKGPAVRDTYLQMGAMQSPSCSSPCGCFCGWAHLQPPARGGLSLLLDAGGFRAAGGWLGGRLVYHHGIGRG